MKKVISIGFVAILLCSLIATAVLPDVDFSQMENRHLAKLPVPSLSTVTSGQWMSDMELWLADQFPGRTFFVRTKAGINYLLGQREIGGALIGADGQLFESFSPDINQTQLDKNMGFIQQFASGLNGNVYFLPTYSAFTIYPERLPAYVSAPDERGILSQLNLPQNVQIVDAYDALLSAKDQPIYFKTDHHWTQQGAYHAYLAYCQTAGLTPVTDYDTLGSQQPFYGSLFSKAPLWSLEPDAMSIYDIKGDVHITYDLDPSDTADTLYTLPALEEKDQYTVFFDGNHACVNIETAAGTGKTLIVLKDSFAHPLVSFLTAHYDRIIMLDMRYYNFLLSDVMAEHPDADVLLSYNLSWLTQDANLFKILR